MNPMKRLVHSAGFVIVDFGDPVPRVLCLMDDFHNWDFPKGHVEPGETHLKAAARETREESGLTWEDYIPSDHFASTAPYSVSEGKKIATYFFARRASDKKPWLPVNPHLGKPEHIKLAWFPLTKLSQVMPKRLQGVVAALESWAASVREEQV